MTTTRRKATTMVATTTTTTVRLQRRENRRKNKVRAALLLMAAANKEGTNSRRGCTPSVGLNTEQGNYECVCLLYYWQQHNNTLGSRGSNSSFHWCWSCLQFAVTNWEIRKRSINKYFSCFDTNNQCICYMTHLLLLGKFEYTGGPIFKVVLEC